MTDKRSCRDFLSDLSLGIIHKILALVPIKDAVRTSILSRKWRYKWTSLPELTFYNKFADEAKRKHVIHQALLLHEGPIEKFKLHVWNMERCSYTDQWLIFLSRKDIRKLILDFRGSLIHSFQVHSSLYCCQNLTHLELFGCALPLPPPTFKGFLYLRRLLLQYVDVPSAMIGNLVASSPLLEELSFDNQKRVHYYKLITRSPNLKCLSFSGFFDEICWYAPLLAKLKIFSFKENFTDEFLQQRRPVSNCAELLGGFPELEEFRTNFSVIKYLTIGIGSCQRSPMFLRLRLVELRDMSFDDVKVISVVFHLIIGAPNLQKLIISCDYPKQYASVVAGVSSSWDTELIAPGFTYERLKVIEMKNVGLHEMRLIKFLLERSPVLETMYLTPFKYLTDEQLLDMTAELLRFRRASTNSEILFAKRVRKPSLPTIDEYDDDDDDDDDDSCSSS